MVVTRRPGASGKDRWFARLSTTSAIVPWKLHSNDLDTGRRALVERVYCVTRGGRLVPPPKPLAGIFSTLAPFRDKVSELCADCRVWSYDGLIASYAQQPAKQRKIADAVISLGRCSLRKSDAMVEMFVKAEMFDKSVEAYAPRAIQFRSARYNAFVGRFLRPAEHAIYAAIATLCGEPTVMKGYNCREVAAFCKAKWDRLLNPCFVGMDASRYDQHVSVAGLQFEHEVYDLIFKHPGLRRALAWQLVNVGRARFPDGSIKYKREGCRMSGDMNTALGNCLLMCAMVWKFCLDNGIKPSFVNNGDDSGIFCEYGEAKRLARAAPAWFIRYGFTMVVEPVVREFEQVEFCQTHPVLTVDGYAMVRSPHRTCSRDWNNRAPNMSKPVHDYKSWLRQVGTCGLAVAGSVPIYSEMYQLMLRLSVEGNPNSGQIRNSGFEFMAKGLPAKASPITPEARASFFFAFGIKPDEQVELERYYRSCQLEPTWRVDDRFDLAASTVPALTEVVQYG